MAKSTISDSKIAQNGKIEKRKEIEGKIKEADGKKGSLTKQKPNKK